MVKLHFSKENAAFLTKFFSEIKSFYI